MSRIRANKITNQAANGAPIVEHGLVVSGILSATSVAIAGTITYEDVTSIDSVGIITARSTFDAQGDVLISDKIVHKSDTNTAIRFPTNDNITFETGGTERLRIDSSGRVAIGLSAYVNTTPSEYDAAANTLIVGTGSGDEGITILSGQNVGNYGSIFFADGNGATNSKRGQLRYEQNNEVMSFYTAGSEKLRIDSAGNMGLGGTPVAPGYTSFTIHESGSGGHVRLNMTNAATGNTAADGFSLTVNGSTQNTHFIQRETADMIFQTSGSERLRIASGGQVIIGDDDISKANGNFDDLIVGANTSTTENHGITIVCGNAATNGGIAFSDGSAGGADAYRGMITYVHNDNHMHFRTNAVERLRLDSLGRLSLGVSATGSYPVGSTARQVQAEIKGSISGDAYHHGSLAINCTNNNANLHIVRSQNIQTSGVALGSVCFTGFDGTDFHLGARITVSRDATGGNNNMPARLEFLTTADGASTPTERLRIDSTGRVLVNTTTTYTSNQIMIVKGASPTGGGNRPYDGQLAIESTETSGAINTGGVLAFIGHDGGTSRGFGSIRNLKEDGTSGNYGTYMSFETRANGSAPAEKVRITSDGKVGINETAPSAMLHVENDNANSSTYYLNTDAAILVQNKNSNASAKTVLKLEGPVGSGDCALVYGAGSTNMIFADRENERMRISSSGYVSGNINVPAWFGKQDTAHNVATATWTTVVNLGNEVTNPSFNNGAWNESNGIFTVQAGQAGTYYVFGACGIDDIQSDDVVRVGISKNNGTPSFFGEQRAQQVESNQIYQASVAMVITVAETDTIRLKVYHNEGSGEATEPNRTYFGGYRLSV